MFSQRAIPIKSMTTHGEWMIDEFCEQCRSFRLDADCIDRGKAHGFVWRKLEIESGATCPLCRFFDAALHGHQVSKRVMHTTTFRLDDLRITNTEEHFQHRPPITGILRMYKPHWSNDGPNYGRYLLPLPQHPGREWPHSRASRHALFELPSQYRSLPYRHLSANSIDIVSIRQWVAGCRTEHRDSCASPSHELLSKVRSSSGFTLIECSSRKIIKPPAVFEYVALSYVWGQSLAQEATSPNSQKCLPAKLPNTIEDALKVTIQLGFQYLWVDKYCINQSPHTNELRTQLAAMDLIYHCAEITIIAAAGSDANYGLPGVRKRRRVLRPSIKINGITWTSGIRDTELLVKQSTWRTRGWTYQEGHFARRRLTFTDEQVLYECNRCTRNETMNCAMGRQEDISSDIFGLNRSSPRTALTLHTHIQNYTETNLTYPSDALYAMQGLFASFSKKHTPEKQFWGIPISTVPTGHNESTFPPSPWNHPAIVLMYGLAWSIRAGALAQRRPGFPSWSWAGWTAPIKWRPTAWPPISKSRIPAQISVLKTNGADQPLTEQLIDDVFMNNDNETAAPHTYRLLVKAEIIRIRFDRLNVKDHKRTYMSHGNSIDLSTSPSSMTSAPRKRFTYAVVQRIEGAEAPYYWILQPTPSIDADSELRRAICEESFDCIVLDPMHGLVVRSVNGVAERLGRINLHSWQDLSNVWDDGTYDSLRCTGPHLRDFLGGDEREILLG
ncbi:heterokaryon incompatibility protein-domain-containing protein [Phaeosphaeria sp. MPI-PUGE-AT-0046c]|nr:heterokaryon incompatibility protein-domain-containing protein [Phaeosphaeria sp. MPI-PUGE-AT-0046c]